MKKVVCIVVAWAVFFTFVAAMFSVQTMAAELPSKANAGMTAGKSADPYTDVTLKKVDKDTYNAVKFLKSHKAFKNVISGSKFYPNKKITRRQFLLVLQNLYGNKVPVTYTDLKNMNKSITAKYACDKMVAIAKKCGVKITWNGSKSVILTRGGAAVYIKIFVDFTKSWLPLKN